MARTKQPDSNRSFGGLELPKDQEEKLQAYLKKKGISLNTLTRSMYRVFMKNGEIGKSDL